MAAYTGILRLMPLPMRQEIKHHWRRFKDARQGLRFDNAQGAFDTGKTVCITQPIMHGAFYENKLTNIARGAALLDQNLIPAGANWSFWHRIGRADKANGFVTGRNLVNGELVTQTGGGLCQLSSLVYHLGLLAGLTVIERHPHSIDIYEEHQRFTPLGADATVVRGYKDLRLHNPHAFAVRLALHVHEGKLFGAVHMQDSNFQPPTVEFVRVVRTPPFVQVDTLVNQRIETVTVYEQKPGMQVTG